MGSKTTSTDNVASSIDSLKELMAKVEKHPVRKFAVFLHSKFCVEDFCETDTPDCAERGIDYLEYAQEILDKVVSFFPNGISQTKPSTRKSKSRKMRLNDEDKYVGE